MSNTRHNINSHRYDSMQKSSSRKFVHSRRNHSQLNPVLIIVAVLAIIIAVSCSIRIVNASDKEEKTMYKYFTSVTVKADDTLWDIANEYSYKEKAKTYVNNIMSINKSPRFPFLLGLFYYSHSFFLGIFLIFSNNSL